MKRVLISLFFLQALTALCAQKPLSLVNTFYATLNNYVLQNDHIEYQKLINMCDAGFRVSDRFAQEQTDIPSPSLLLQNYLELLRDKQVKLAITDMREITLSNHRTEGVPTKTVLVNVTLSSSQISTYKLQNVVYIRNNKIFCIGDYEIDKSGKVLTELVHETLTNSTSVSAKINKVWVVDNVMFDKEKFLEIHINFTTENMGGKIGQVAAYFYDSDNNALLDANGSYKSADGHVAFQRTFTPQATYNYTCEDFTLYMPYYELHAKKSGTYKFQVIIWNDETKLATYDWVGFIYNAPNVSEANGTHNGHEYVDLGLSVMWATCNVGASKPEEFGNYYAWGEVAPKKYYGWNTYKYCNGSYKTLTKYNTVSDFGLVDNKTTLEPNDDAATANWGRGWRTPTKAELEELRNYCTWEWTSLNGVIGCLITSERNGRSIFWPAAGSKYKNSLDTSPHKNAWSWSSTISNSKPYTAYSRNADNMTADYYYGSRVYGYSVRPVLSLH